MSVDISSSPLVTDASVTGQYDYEGLVPLNTVKQLLGIPLDDDTHDAYLGYQIKWISERVEAYCARIFKAQDYAFSFPIRAECPAGTSRRVAYHCEGLCLTVQAYPILETYTVVVDGTTIPDDNYSVDARTGEYMSVCFPGAEELIEITYRAGFDPVPAQVANVIADLVSGRYYNQGSDPSRIIRAESVPDVANVSYLSSVYYQADYDPILGQYGSVLDPFRTEGALGFSATDDPQKEACW